MKCTLISLAVYLLVLHLQFKSEKGINSIRDEMNLNECEAIFYGAA